MKPLIMTISAWRWQAATHDKLQLVDVISFHEKYIMSKLQIQSKIMMDLS
jgi:hypothetical protein